MSTLINKLATYGFIFGIVLIIISITKNSWQMYTASQRLTLAKQKVQQLQTQRYQLLVDLQKRNSPEFLEEQIRNKLNLIKPGETMLVLPSFLKDTKNEAEFLTPKITSEEVEEIPNWQVWYELFL